MYINYEVNRLANVWVLNSAQSTSLDCVCAETIFYEMTVDCKKKTGNNLVTDQTCSAGSSRAQQERIIGSIPYWKG